VCLYIVPQIRDALGGLTFSKTPAFNHTSLQESPLSFYDQYGDDRNTTYSSDTVKTPAFTTQYARVSRRLLHHCEPVISGHLVCAVGWRRLQMSVLA
jgi:hypothetical protein